MCYIQVFFFFFQKIVLMAVTVVAMVTKGTLRHQLLVVTLLLSQIIELVTILQVIWPHLVKWQIHLFKLF